MTDTTIQTEFGPGIKFYSDWPNEAKLRTGMHLQHAVARDSSLTLHIEIAPIAAPGQSPNWQEKIVLQLTRGELVAVCATLLGFRKTAKGSYHGKQRNKGFQVHSNPSKGALFALNEKGVQLQHMVDQNGRAEIAAFILNRVAQAWQLDPGTCLAVLTNVEKNIPVPFEPA